MATDVQTPETEEQRAERTRTGPVFRPSVDILERQDELTIVAEIPGVKSNAVDIDFEDGVLTIHGKVEPRTSANRQILLAEYGIGDFYRTFRVSEKIDAGAIHADHADGVLVIHLPKATAARPRKIEVRSAG